MSSTKQPTGERLVFRPGSGPQGDVLVFVEVRLRRRVDFGGAAASITAAKRARMIAAAGLYLARLQQTPACRFDAILLDALDPARIEWLRDVVAA